MQSNMISKVFSRRNFIQTFSLPFIASGLSVSDGIPDMDKLKDLLKSDQPVTWVFTGDSVTQGAHHTYGVRCYPEVIGERVRWELRRINDIFINSGVNGTNTKYLLDAYEWFVNRFRPSIVSVMYGINDCQEKAITISLFEEYLTEIIRKIRQQNAIPVIQTPNGIDMEGMLTMKTASREKLPEYVDIIRSVAAKQNCILIDNWKQWKDSSAELMKTWLDDPMHPNALGHLLMARSFFRVTDICDERSFSCTGKK